MLFASVVTDLINAALQVLGYFFAKLVNVLIAGLMQAIQWIGVKVASFAIGMVTAMLSAIPGVTFEDAFNAGVVARTELAKWNNLFPVYESLSCLTVIFTFRIAVGVYRSYHTMIWHAANLHNTLPKIAGTG